jgi:hypothetical protein
MKPSAGSGRVRDCSKIAARPPRHLEAVLIVRSTFVLSSILTVLSFAIPVTVTAQRVAKDDLLSAPEPQAQQTQQSTPAQQQPSTQQQSQPANPPNLSDLGFSTEQTKADPKLQARLDRRTHMLKVHQKLGLITLAPMAAALFTGPMAKGEGRDGQPFRAPSDANLDFHAALGGLTAAMYFTTAWYAIDAPRIPGTHHRGPIRFHEALAFIHGPGMIATPILGIMAYNQEQRGERVHGAASAHGAVAGITVAAYAASMLAVSWPPRFPHRH